jgi:hypothetical protein
MRIGLELIWCVPLSALALVGGCHKAKHPPTHGTDAGVVDAGAELGACVTVTPRDVDFGNVVVNTTATGSVAITNDCGINLSVTVGTLRGTDPLLFATNPPAGTVINLGDRETKALLVQYQPLVASPVQSQAYFAFNLCGSGTGCEPLVSLRGTAVATGLCVNPFILNFGFVPPNHSVTMSIGACNCANAAIHFTSDPEVLNDTGGTQTLSGPFQPGPGFPTSKTDIPLGQCVPVTVVFTPPSAGFFTGEVDVSTDDPQSSNLKIPLQGYGGGAAISCAPLALDFGANAVGVSSTQSLSCTNVGTNVPGHPEANLFIPDPASADPGLTIQNGVHAFQASFDRP